jgi:catechol 2,3-dioxygenase-like lactoylglutathione lyase family enzyme
MEQVMSQTITGAKLRSVTPVFLVSDIEATMRWYQRILGFEADAVPEAPPYDFCILRKDDVVIFLQQLAEYQKPDLYGQREGGVWSAYLHTQGIADLYETLRQHPDVVVVQPLRRQPYRQSEFEIRDPNGYVLVFAEPW